MLVEYRTISIVLCDRLAAASINRATSSTLRMWGNRRGDVEADGPPVTPTLPRRSSEVYA
jgi:hypothetical protein